MTRFLMDAGQAVAFLSRLPVPDLFFSAGSRPVSQSAGAFALAAIVVALPASAILFALLFAGVSPLFAAALCVGGLVLTTGGLHEDGLADCADGFGGGRERQKRLDIMKDSAVGAYGAMALILSLLLRSAGIAAIATAASPLAASFAVVGVATISRAAMVWHWHHLPPARAGGVASGAGQPSRSGMLLAVLSGAFLGVLFLAPAIGFIGTLLPLGLTAAACTVFNRLVQNKIQGHTGDTIGATQQISEVAAWLGLALLV